MIKMAAFDLDGTIADTIPMCIKAFRESVSPYCGQTLTDEEIVRTFGLNETGMVKAVVKNDWENALRDFYEKYKTLHGRVDSPFPGIYELLSYLKESKIFTAVITGKGKKSCDLSLEILGLKRFFDEVLYGSEIKPNKTENINFLVKKYSVSKSDFYYVGDTAQDIAACKCAGVTCLSAAWQKFSHSDILEKENKDLVFYSVKALQKYFSSLI